MRHSGPAIFMVIVFLGLGLLLALRTGSVWLFPTQRMVSRNDNPVGYWLAFGVWAVLFVGFFGLMVWGAVTSREP